MQNVVDKSIQADEGGHLPDPIDSGQKLSSGCFA